MGGSPGRGRRQRWALMMINQNVSILEKLIHFDVIVSIARMDRSRYGDEDPGSDPVRRRVRGRRRAGARLVGRGPRLPGREAGGYSGRAMAITVKYFASLRERMGRGEERLDLPSPATVEEVWRRVGGGGPLAGDLLAAVNLEYVDPDHAVADGDEVAFFPPVTGG